MARNLPALQLMNSELTQRFSWRNNDQRMSSEFRKQAPNTTLADIPFAMVFGSK